MNKLLASIGIFSLLACTSTQQVGYEPYSPSKRSKAKQVFDLPVEKAIVQQQDTLWLLLNLQGSSFLNKEDAQRKCEIHLAFFNSQFSRKCRSEMDTSLHFKREDIFDFKVAIPEMDGDVFYRLTVTDVHRNVYHYSDGYVLGRQEETASPFVLQTKGTWQTRGIRKSPEDSLLFFISKDSFAIERFPLNCNALPNTDDMLRPKVLKADSLFYLKTSSAVEDLKFSSGYYYRVKTMEGNFCFGWSQCYSNNDFNAINYLRDANERANVDFIKYQKFWFDLAKGDAFEKDRLLAEFEKRKQWCNSQFTSYVDGWKTHRGWVYIVLGPPNRIETSLDSERWFYNFSPTEDGVLIFLKNPQGLHPNDYILDWKQVTRYEIEKGIRKWLTGAINTGY